MKKLILLSAVSVLSAAVFAQTAEFSTADADANGILSIAEAAAVLATVTITDTDSNGVLSEAEAEDAVEGLSLPVESAEDDNETVDADDYALIVAALSASAE